MTTLGDQYIDAIEAGDTKRAESIAAQLDAETEQEHQRVNSITLISAALYYGLQGIPVFPCWPRRKNPMTKNGVKAATADAEQIRYWWERCPDANIGLAAGHKADVVDIDGPGGYDHMYRDNDDGSRFESLTVLGVASTPSGGQHIYIPRGLLPKNSAKKIHAEIDTRVLGGYTLAAPSVGENGKPYRWIVPLELS